MRACVIGAGVVGCSIGLALRRAGWEVDVLDRHGDVGHGSTAASCAIVRRYYSQPGMIAMAHEGASIWADWGGFLGPIDDDLAVFQRPGMLFIPPRVDDTVRRIVAEMQRIGVRAHLWTPEDVARRFPFLDLGSQHPPCPPDDPRFLEPASRRIEGAVFEEDAGYVVGPALATQNLRRAAEREGARFKLGHEVTAVRTAPSGTFAVTCRGGARLEADVVVNAAGPHSARINALAGVELSLETRPLRREVHALRNPLVSRSGESRRGEAGLPVVGDLDGGIYFRPEAGGAQVIVGSTDPECDALEWVADPDDFEATVTARVHERQCLRLMKRFPDVRLEPPRGVAALYDVTVQDWYPIADRTDLPGYFVCIGTSGSSFKTAPVLGQWMAAVIEAVRDGHDPDREPVTLELARIGVRLDGRFLARNRGVLQSSGTVIG